MTVTKTQCGTRRSRHRPVAAHKSNIGFTRNSAVFSLFFVAAIAVGATPGFAQQVINGAAPTPLDATGVTSGVSMTGQGGGGTLIVGTVGGPEMDIFTNNSAGGVVVNPLLPAVQTDVSSQSNITFNSSSTVFGTIGVTPLASPIFLNLSGGNTGTTDNFQGNVNATQFIVGGTGTVNFNSGSTNNVTNLIYGADGTIGLGVNTRVNGALTTTAGANTGTLSLAGGSFLNGAVGGAIGLRAINVVGGSNIAGVSANISGAVDAFSFALGTNTLNIGGALNIANQGPTGTISTTLSTPTVFGHIVAGGATSLGPLTITVSVPATAVFPVGTDFTIVQSGGTGTSGIVATVVTTNPLYSFAQVPTPGSVTPGPTNATGFVVLTTLTTPLQVASTPPPGVVLPPAAPIAAAIGTTLLAGVQTPDIIAVENAINALTNAAAVVNAEKQLAPSASDVAAGLVTFQGTRQFQDLWLARLDDVMCGDVNALKLDDAKSICRKNEPTSGWWVKSFGYFGSQGQQGAFDGYQSRTLGTMIAYDAPLPGLRDTSLGIETRIGLGIGYAQTTINDTGLANSTNFNTYRATAYISHDHGPWFVDGDVSFGWSDYSGARNSSFPGVSRRAQANYSGQDYTAFGITGIHLPVGVGITLTPFASLQFTRMNLDGYTESGAGDISLKVNAQRYDFLESGLGGKVTRPFAGSGGSYVPEGHFKWLHDIASPKLANTASFTAGSPQFSTPAVKNSPDTFNLGAGLTFLTCSCSANNWSVAAVYAYYWRPDKYSAHQGTVKFSARF